MSPPQGRLPAGSPPEVRGNKRPTGYCFERRATRARAVWAGGSPAKLRPHGCRHLSETTARGRLSRDGYRTNLGP